MRYLITLLGLVACASLPNEATDLYRFSAGPEFWGEGELLEYDQEVLVFSMRDKLLISGDSGIGFWGCEDDSEWLCIGSYALNFAVNRKWQNFPEKWEHNGNQYEYIGGKTLTVFGNDYFVEEIYVEGRFAGPKFQNVIFYSRENGIIAFVKHAPGDERTRMYFSEGAVGPFAGNMGEITEE